MKDRNVQHASRFRLTKVPGTDDVYDLIPAPGEVYEEGTLINKSALLKDATAALFGLDENAVPDDVFGSIISRSVVNLHVWKKYQQTPSETTNERTSYVIGFGTIYYASSFTNDGTNFYLSSPSATTPSNSNVTSALLGKYIIDSNSSGKTMLYIPSDATVTVRDASTGAMYFSKAILHTNPCLVETNISFVSATDIAVYPPSVSDGYEYDYMGQLGNKSQIATGSYTGTGTYGSSNPNSLTFDFEPKLILIPLHTGSDSYGLWYQSLVPKDNYYTIIPFSNVPTEYTRGAGFGVTSSDVFGKKAGNTLYWYNTSSAYNQFNAAATDYYWVAIG